MDSLTQATLGAAVGEAVLGPTAGRKAAVWGAVCGTLPDLDVFVPMGDVVSDFTYHRSFSHSLFVLAALTPAMVWLILRIHPRERANRARWFVLVYLALTTHALLDAFTVYGTQLLWPIPRPPVTWSTIFIIDPAYTLPLLVGVVAALTLGRASSLGHRLNALGLVLSTAYLAWGVGAKLHVESVVHEALAARQVRHERVLTTPTPFNTLLWRILVMSDGGDGVDGADREYREGFYSLAGPGSEIELVPHRTRPELLASLAGDPHVERLKWFTKGFYAVSAPPEGVVMTDLRMGIEPDYIFRFVVGTHNGSEIAPVEPRLLEPEPPVERLGWVWARIWEPNLGP